ncbi:hypothetical protein [Kribbella karoonensis]|uniref:Uncharacterized protein n=1 Tax=Kribbella karoonensis TaxID=324851 RepID=A0ABN2DTE8_9ACTN
MSHGEQWRVQLWLGEHLMEDHIGPAALAERLTEHELAYPASRAYGPRD